MTRGEIGPKLSKHVDIGSELRDKCSAIDGHSIHQALSIAAGRRARLLRHRTIGRPLVERRP
jgi:hypothetical protein